MSHSSEEDGGLLFDTTDIRRTQVILAALILGTVLVLTMLVVHFGETKANFEDAATLGAQTTSVFAKVGRYPIHCMDSRDAAACLAGMRDRMADKSALWLGNSQLHAINQFRPGETNAAPILFNDLALRGMDLLTFSQPNASLQEHYVMFEYLRERLPLRALILPVVFDDFREEGLRDEVAVFARDETTALSLSNTEIGRRLVAIARAVPQDHETAGIAQTIQERVERSLNGWVETHSQLWSARPVIRGELFVGLYKLRNAVLGIKATSKRRMIPGRFRDNWAALDAILASAKRNDISLVLYLAPLREGVEIPYDKAEYSRFKSEMESLAKQHKITYANLESLVPAQFWGAKDATGLGDEAELDFMHFQAGGHKQLAARLDQLIADALAGRKDNR